MMVDFAIERELGRAMQQPLEAVYQGCLVRFRPTHDDHDGRAYGNTSYRDEHGLLVPPRRAFRTGCLRRTYIFASWLLCFYYAGLLYL